MADRTGFCLQRFRVRNRLYRDSRQVVAEKIVSSATAAAASTWREFEQLAIRDQRAADETGREFTGEKTYQNHPPSSENQQQPNYRVDAHASASVWPKDHPEKRRFRCQVHRPLVG